MIYRNNNKRYQVSSVAYDGMIINVNGTSITDYSQYSKRMLGIEGKGYSVFCDSDELYFETFDEAYDFAMNKQKNTFRISE